MPVIAARSPVDCFDCAVEAVRIAVEYMTPVMLLTDGYIANAAEPWLVPDLEEYKPFPVEFLESVPEGGFKPYARDHKLKRPWVKPGTPGLLHRIGGIEKEVDTGHINYAPANHQAMTDIRSAKVNNVADSIPDQIVEQGAAGAKLAVIGWGSTYGPIKQAVRRKRAEGMDVAHVHIRHIWPMPKNMGDLLKSFDKIIVPEMNTGQLKTILRDQFLVDAKPVNKVSGQPFTIAEIEAAIESALG
jgi:2-oxoglutarate ferredoxin oxidoreductase subunit alpha